MTPSPPVSGVKQALTINAEIEQTIADLKNCVMFWKVQAGRIPKAEDHKAFGTAKQIENIPAP